MLLSVPGDVCAFYVGDPFHCHKGSVRVCISILRIKKLRHLQALSLVQTHTAREQQITHISPRPHGSRAHALSAACLINERQVLWLLFSCKPFRLRDTVVTCVPSGLCPRRSSSWLLPRLNHSSHLSLARVPWWKEMVAGNAERPWMRSDVFCLHSGMLLAMETWRISLGLNFLNYEMTDSARILLGVFHL